MITLTFDFWIVLAIVAIICELLSLSFFLLSIGFGAIAAGILNYYNFDPVQQVIAFIVITILFVIISRPLAKHLTKNSSKKKATTDRFLGKKGVTIENINPKSSGRIRIYGEEWRAISDQDIQKGEEVIVQNVSGVKLVVKKIE